MRSALFLIFFISLGAVRAQISNDNCNAAGVLCPGIFETVNNLNTTVNTCLSCQDDFTACFTPLNTAWFSFTTYAGGNASLRMQNLQFNPNVDNLNNSFSIAIFQADVPCFSQSYTLFECLADINSNTTLPLSGLLPNTNYYVVFSGTQNGPTANAPSEVQLDVRITGQAVTRPAAQVSIGASPTEVCKGAPVTLIADLNLCPNNTAIDWYRNNQFWFTSSIGAITIDDAENGDQFYAQTTCYDVCIETIQTNTLTLVVHDFIVDAGNDVTILQGEGTQLNGSTTETSFFWSPPVGLTNPNMLNPVASPEITTMYYLTSSNGICELVDSVTITVISDLVVPNVFSPNNDGINDVWEILGTENYEDVYVQVYDRSGQRVLESVNYNPLRFWNGTHRNKPLPVSTYFYVIVLDRNSDKEKVLKGSVTIIN